MSINLKNYEEWMVAYIDGELNLEEQKSFKTFLKKYPELRSELIAFQSLQFSPDAKVVYENKKGLYKKEGAYLLFKKILPMAAIFVLLLALLPFVKQDKPIEIERQLAKVIQQQNESAKKITKGAFQRIEPEINEVSNQTPPKPMKKVICANKFKKKKNITLFAKTTQPEKTEKVVAQKEISTNHPFPKVNIQNSPPIEEKVAIQKPPKIIPPISEKKIAKTEAPIIENGLLLINENNHPVLHQKLNNVVAQVEDKIEKVKTLKKTPITVCIGKRKLFTLNN